MATNRHPPQRRNLTIRSATASPSLVSHSQITITRQPSSCSASALRRSLTTFPSNLSSQNRTRVFGLVAYLQPGCRCQKHPWTMITARCFGNTRSGEPGRSRR